MTDKADSGAMRSSTSAFQMRDNLIAEAHTLDPQHEYAWQETRLTVPDAAGSDDSGPNSDGSETSNLTDRSLPRRD